jgi:hypothetical protein
MCVCVCARARAVVVGNNAESDGGSEVGHWAPVLLLDRREAVVLPRAGRLSDTSAGTRKGTTGTTAAGPGIGQRQAGLGPTRRLVFGVYHCYWYSRTTTGLLLVGSQFFL